MATPYTHLPGYRWMRGSASHSHIELWVVGSAAIPGVRRDCTSVDNEKGKMTLELLQQAIAFAIFAFFSIPAMAAVLLLLLGLGCIVLIAAAVAVGAYATWKEGR